MNLGKYNRYVPVLGWLLVCALFQFSTFRNTEEQGMLTGFNLFQVAFSFVGGCVLLLIYDKVKEVSPEKLFSTAVLLVGIIYIFVLTPLSPPDERLHYHTAYEISEYIMGQDGATIPYTHFNYDGISIHNNTRLAYETCLQRYTEDVGDQTLAAVPEPVKLNYFVEYLPQTIALVLARLTNMNFINTFLLGRLLNLLFFTACVYFSVKIIPKYKHSLGLLCLFPITVQQAASYSYDSFIIGISFCLLAVLLKSVYADEKMSRKLYAEILFFSILLLPTKIVSAYSLLIFLFLLIPKEKFQSIKDKYLKFLILIILCLLFLGIFQWNSLTTLSEPSQEVVLNWEGKQNYTLEYCLQHPYYIMRIFLKTLVIMPRHWYRDLFTLSGLNMPLPYLIKIVITVILIVAVLGEENTKLIIKKKEKLFFAILFALLIFVFLCAMLLVWTSDFRDTVVGIQGRYFIPFLPLLFMLTDNRKFVLKRAWMERLTGYELLMQWLTIIYIVDFTLKH